MNTIGCKGRGWGRRLTLILLVYLVIRYDQSN